MSANASIEQPRSTASAGDHRRCLHLCSLLQTTKNLNLPPRTSGYAMFVALLSKLVPATVTELSVGIGEGKSPPKTTTDKRCNIRMAV